MENLEQQNRDLLVYQKNIKKEIEKSLSVLDGLKSEAKLLKLAKIDTKRAMADYQMWLKDKSKLEKEIVLLNESITDKKEKEAKVKHSLLELSKSEKRDMDVFKKSKQAYAETLRQREVDIESGKSLLNQLQENFELELNAFDNEKTAVRQLENELKERQRQIEASEIKIQEITAVASLKELQAEDSLRIADDNRQKTQEAREKAQNELLYAEKDRQKLETEWNIVLKEKEALEGQRMAVARDRARLESQRATFKQVLQVYGKREN